MLGNQAIGGRGWLKVPQVWEMKRCAAHWDEPPVTTAQPDAALW